MTGKRQLLAVPVVVRETRDWARRIDRCARRADLTTAEWIRRTWRQRIAAEEASTKKRD